MCLHKKFYYKILFWTCVSTLILVIIVSGYELFESISLKQKYDKYETLIESHYQVMMIAISFCSLCMILGSIFALIGVVLDKFPILILSSYTLLVISFLSILVGLWVLTVSRNTVDEMGMTYGLVDKLEFMMKKPDFLPYNASVLDPLNKDYDCCGIFSYKDYSTQASRKWLRDLVPLPNSCCYDSERNCKPGTDEHKTDGCLYKYTLSVTESYGKFATFLLVFGMSTGINGFYVNMLAKKAKEVYLYYPYYF